MNFLEELVAEWYEYQGYFVRRNVLVGRRPEGGHECELDVVAFHPKKNHLVHVEPTTDALSFKKREQRFQKKFKAGRDHIPKLFEGLSIPPEIDQYSVLGFGRGEGRETLGGRRFVLYEDLLAEILAQLKNVRMESHAVSENFPLLRMLQTIAKHRKKVIEVLGTAQHRGFSALRPERRP